MSAASTSCCNSCGLLAVADDAAPALILLTNWCYCVQNIIKIGVEDIASQSSVIFEHN